MSKKKDRSSQILFKALSRNFFNILKYYPAMVRMAGKPEKYPDELKHDYCMKLIHDIIDTCEIKVEAYGLENIPEENGFYLCSNHQEKFDPLAIWYTCPKTLGVILEDKATHRPFISELCRLVRTQKLKHKNVRVTIQRIHDITQDLKKGYNYMVFPEGDYEKENGKLDEFRPGSFKGPLRAQSPILPVCVVDSYCIFDKGYRTSKPIQVHYLKPIQPSEFEGMSTQELAELVKSRIQAALDIYQK